MKVIGIKKVSYDRKRDGKRIEGMEVHYTYPSKYIEGEGCDKAFIGSAAIESMEGEILKVGDEVEFVYNRFGGVAGYKIIA